MRLRPVATAVLVVALGGLYGCGGSGSSSSSKSSGGVPGSARHHGRPPVRKYVVRMTGSAETPPGAPDGSGDAIIALHDRPFELCWRFAHLHGFKDATYAHIHRGPPRTSGDIVVPLSTGAKLHHEGCARISATLLNAIKKDPGAFYVNIHSKQYPNGAVRAQL